MTVKPSPLRDALIDGFKLSDTDVDDLLAFLESLTDKSFLTNPKFADPFTHP
jgi:cytochrome c peroxidase